LRKTSLQSLSRRLLCLVALGAANLYSAPGSSILFAGLGSNSNGSSPNDGSLALINQTTGAVSILVQPSGVPSIFGLTFDPTGVLFATAQIAPGSALSGSELFQLNPLTGVVVIGVAITDGVNGISIGSLAIQPGTGTLYGMRTANDGLGGQGGLYVIDKVSGLATLLGNSGHYFGAIAFAADGTLYLASADLDPGTGNVINPFLLTVDPSSGATLNTVPLAQEVDALAVRPEDGALFGGSLGVTQLFLIDPGAGAMTPVGNAGVSSIGGLAFRSPMVLAPGQCVGFPVTALAPAGPEGSLVTINISSANVMSDLGTGNLLIAPGETTARRTPELCGVKAGAAAVRVSGSGTLMFVQPVQVAETLSFYPASILLSGGMQARPMLILSSPASSNLRVALSSDDPTVARVPAFLVIPANATSAYVPVTSVSSGSTTIHAGAARIPAAALLVTVQ
jgi:hypothetical protein